MIKLLLTDALSQKVVERLNEIPEFEIVVKRGMNPYELKEEIKNYEAVVVSPATILDKEILEGAQQLKIIIEAGIETDNIDVEVARSRNIEVRNTPLATAITVAEYTLAQMLGICRFIGPAYQSMKAHKWEKKLFSQGIELYGKTAGIIGMGRIGKEVAKRQLAMGMKVLYYDIVEVKADTKMDAHLVTQVKKVTLDELLGSSDFISLHLPLTESTRNLVSTDAFEKMKEGVVFVNAARGGVVDEDALMKALAGDKIRAVGLDVYEREPLEEFALIDHEKVFPAPHLGASTVEAQERAGFEAISILREFFNV
ncbi:MAG: 3-phosphoglycerate dehydrogenase [Candidatus Aminicenantes bacterium]|nr:MAG: 3-phosphoglycerate dehydrogenase [Candidatus Aminicenantes bacterium]